MPVLHSMVCTVNLGLHDCVDPVTCFCYMKKIDTSLIENKKDMVQGHELIELQKAHAVAMLEAKQIHHFMPPFYATIMNSPVTVIRQAG